MNDPHVDSLTFDVSAPAENISYGDPEPMTFGNEIAEFHVNDCVLVVSPTDHYADVGSALRVVEPFLRSWEVITDLTQNPGQLKFTYRTANVIDRDPPPPGTSQRVTVSGGGSITVTGHAAIVGIQCGKYPDPPIGFAATSTVELYHARWLQFRNGKQSLEAMAYFILHAIQRAAGNREKAAKQLSVSRNVLDKISHLSSAKGDPMTARKSDYIEMTAAERRWLSEAVKIVIIRSGEIASGAEVQQITLAELSDLR